MTRRAFQGQSAETKPKGTLHATLSLFAYPTFHLTTVQRRRLYVTQPKTSSGAISRHHESSPPFVDDHLLWVAEYFDVLRLQREDLRNPLLVQRPERCRVIDRRHFPNLDLHRYFRTIHSSTLSFLCA
jgi:hypothetical protein